MTGVVLANPRVKFSNAAGVPLALGWVFVYEAGTTTATNTWQDKAQTTLNTNPIHLDANGECLLWGDSAKTYKLLLQTSAFVTVTGWPVDNIPGVADIGAAAVAAAAAAQPYVDDAEAAQLAAEAAQGAAETAEDNAAAYAALAATGAKFYDTIALGLAGTASGSTFGVIASGTDGLIRPTVYRDDAGVATKLYEILPGTEYDAARPEVVNSVVETLPEPPRMLGDTPGPEVWASKRFAWSFHSYTILAERTRMMKSDGTIQNAAAVFERLRGAGCDLVAAGTVASVTAFNNVRTDIVDPITAASVTSYFPRTATGGYLQADDPDSTFVPRILGKTKIALVARVDTSTWPALPADAPLIRTATGELGLKREAGGYRLYAQKISGADTYRWESSLLSPTPSINTADTISIVWDGTKGKAARVKMRFRGAAVAFTQTADAASNPTTLFELAETPIIGSSSATAVVVSYFAHAVWATPTDTEVLWAEAWATEVYAQQRVYGPHQSEFIPITAYGPQSLQAAALALTRSGGTTTGTAAGIPADPDSSLTVAAGAITTISAPAAANMTPFIAGVATDYPWYAVASGNSVQDWRDPTNPLKRLMITAGRAAASVDSGGRTFPCLFKSSDGGATWAVETVSLNAGSPYYTYPGFINVAAPNNLVLQCDGTQGTFIQKVVYLDKPQRMWIGNSYRAAAWVDVRYVMLADLYRGATSTAGLFVSDDLTDPSKYYQVPTLIGPGGWAKADQSFVNQTGFFSPKFTANGFWENKDVIFNKYNGYWYVIVRPYINGWSTTNGTQSSVRQHWIIRARFAGIDGLGSWDVETARPLTPRPNWAYQSYICTITDIGQGVFAMVSCDFLDAALNAAVVPTGAGATRHAASQFSLWTCHDLDRDDFVLQNKMVVDTPSQTWTAGFVHQGYVEPDNNRFFWWGQPELHTDSTYTWKGAYVTLTAQTLRETNGRMALPSMVTDTEGTRVTRQTMAFHAGDTECLMVYGVAGTKGSIRVRLIDPKTGETIPGFGFDGSTISDSFDYRVSWQSPWSQTNPVLSGSFELPPKMVIAEVETRSVTGGGGTKFGGIYARRKRKAQ